MNLSVIIPTRNRSNTLKSCLESLELQTLPADAFEVIVVDNGSTDHTKKVVHSFADTLQIVYRYNEEPGLHVGRHEGMRVARTAFLVFADDDIVAQPMWLEVIQEAFADASVVVVGGNNLPLFASPPPTWLDRLWNRSVNTGRSIGSLSIMDLGEGRFAIDPGRIWGCNFSVRKEVLEHAGGFHPDSLPNDLLRYRGDGETHISNYVRAKGLKAFFDSRASVHHLVSCERMTKSYFCQRAYAQGISDSYSAIRAAGGIPGITFRFRHEIHRRLGKLKLIVENIGRDSDAVEIEMLDVLKSSRTAYWHGFRFHLREAASDDDLLAWVLKENYL